MATLKTKQLSTARELGAKAFNNGIKAICAMDNDLMMVINSRPIGVTPKGEAKSISIMKAWYEGWMNANLR
jgi:hypothetical protein